MRYHGPSDRTRQRRRYERPARRPATREARRRLPARQSAQGIGGPGPRQWPQQPGGSDPIRPPGEDGPRNEQGTGRAPEVLAVEPGERFVRVRIRDPDRFAMVRTPDWAIRAAHSVVPGADVRTGTLRGADELVVERVLIPQPVDRETAVAGARRIVRAVEG